MRKTDMFNTVRVLEELIRGLSAKQALSRSDPTVEWTKRDAEALAAAQNAVVPIKAAAGEFNTTH